MTRTSFLKSRMMIDSDVKIKMPPSRLMLLVNGARLKLRHQKSLGSTGSCLTQTQRSVKHLMTLEIVLNNPISELFTKIKPKVCLTYKTDILPYQNG